MASLNNLFFAFLLASCSSTQAVKKISVEEAKNECEVTLSDKLEEIYSNVTLYGNKVPGNKCGIYKMTGKGKFGGTINAYVQNIIECRKGSMLLKYKKDSKTKTLAFYFSDITSPNFETFVEVYGKPFRCSKIVPKKLCQAIDSKIFPVFVNDAYKMTQHLSGNVCKSYK